MTKRLQFAAGFVTSRPTTRRRLHGSHLTAMIPTAGGGGGGDNGILDTIVGNSLFHPHSGFSSILTADATTTLSSPPTTTTSSDVVFEPIMPQTETLIGMGTIVILCVVVSWVWANQVVPVSRTKLAIDKSRGELKEYLDELKASDPSIVSTGGDNSTTTKTTAESTTTANSTATAMASTEDDTTTTTLSSTTATKTDNRALERWLFTDWLRDNKSARRAGRQKEPALPILKDAKWNSGDNPVLVASTLIGLGVLVSAFVERLLSFTS